jgi:hypothetical protein
MREKESKWLSLEPAEQRDNTVSIVRLELARKP